MFGSPPKTVDGSFGDWSNGMAPFGARTLKVVWPNRELHLPNLFERIAAQALPVAHGQLLSPKIADVVIENGVTPGTPLWFTDRGGHLVAQHLVWGGF